MEIKKNQAIDIDIEDEKAEYKISSYQNEIASQLLNGLGDEIKNTLRRPVKVSRFQILKIKIKNFVKRIIDVL